MTAAIPEPVRNILDDIDTAVIDLQPITEQVTFQSEGWTPPPIVLPDDCGHRAEIGYEHAMAQAADWRRAADEIRTHHDAVYPHLAKAARKRRPKKAT